MLAFLKPGLWKLILAFTLLVVSSILWRLYIISHISDTFPMGFPLQFYLAWGPCPAEQNCSESNGVFLIIDLLFWYVVSGFVVDRVRRKITPHA